MRLATPLCLALGLLGCGGTQVVPAAPPPPEKVDPPGWVLRVPRKEGQICATGAVDPTFYRQDGRTNAAEAARGELARTIQVKVTAVMYDEQTARGSYVDQAIVTETIGSISEAVIAGAEIVSYWFDATGAVSRSGMTYALACMRTDQSVAELAARLEEAFPEEEKADAIEEVKERAKVAFEELERMEAARGARVAGPDPKPVEPGNEAQEPGDEATVVPAASGQ